MAIVAPSLLASDFLHLEEVCIMLNESEAEWFHLDVMDGRFVPNISYGFPVIEHIRKATKKSCDLHLMIDERQLSVQIEVDGGITLENAYSITEAGANVLVAGSTVFKSADPKQTIAQLKSL